MKYPDHEHFFSLYFKKSWLDENSNDSKDFSFKLSNKLNGARKNIVASIQTPQLFINKLNLKISENV